MTRVGGEEEVQPRSSVMRTQAELLLCNSGERRREDGGGRREEGGGGRQQPSSVHHIRRVAGHQLVLHKVQDDHSV